MGLTHGGRWTESLQLSEDNLLAGHVAHLCQLLNTRPSGRVQLLLTLINFEQTTAVQLVLIRLLNS